MLLFKHFIYNQIKLTYADYNIRRIRTIAIILRVRLPSILTLLYIDTDMYVILDDVFI